MADVPVPPVPVLIPEPEPEPEPETPEDGNTPAGTELLLKFDADDDVINIDVAVPGRLEELLLPVA